MDKAIKVENRDHLNEVTRELVSMGLKLIDGHNEQWIKDNIDWAFEDGCAFILIFNDYTFGYANHDGGYKVVTINDLKQNI